MNALARDITSCVPMWRAAVSAPRGDDKPWLGLLLLGIAMAVNLTIWLIYRTTKPITLGFAIGVPLAAYATIMWLRFLRGAVLQNTPANGALVPGLTVRLRRTALLVYVACLAAWVMVASALPRSDRTILIVCLFMTGSMLAFARPRLFYSSLFAIWAWSTGENMFDFPHILWPESTIGLNYVLVALLTWWAFGVTFSEGGNGNARRAVSIQIANSFGEPVGKVFHVQGMGAGRRYARLLRGDIAGGNPGDLMLHALGPRNHRYDFLWALPLIAVLGIVPKLVSDLLWPGHMPFLVEISGVMSIGAFAVMALAFPYRFTSSLPATGAEQGLYRLTPMAPAAPALNRLLAGKILRICLAEWTACLVLMLLVSVVWRLPALATALLTLHMLTVLAAAGWPLRDYAHARTPSRWQGMAQCTLMLALSVVTVLLYKIMGPLVVALPIGASAGMIAWRWRAMAAAPVTFPAGRMYGA